MAWIRFGTKCSFKAFGNALGYRKRKALRLRMTSGPRVHKLSDASAAIYFVLCKQVGKRFGWPRLIRMFHAIVIDRALHAVTIKCTRNHSIILAKSQRDWHFLSCKLTDVGRRGFRRRTRRSH